MTPQRVAAVLARRDGVRAEGGVVADEPGGAERLLLGRLRAGDQGAFTDVVRAWSPGMLQVARTFVGTAASAEEVVQETWLAVLRGLDGFEGRSLLRTWAFSILVNAARRQAVREGRQVPWSHADDGVGPTVDPARFRGPHDRWAGGWTEDGAPRAWGPEAAALSGEIRALLLRALDGLPARQRAVVVLRDVQGLSAGEVCSVLDLSEANQRVLLHRARAGLRRELEDYYRGRTEGVPV
ncbi:MAG: RNA polymerase sigma factor [Blastococcus sp.]